MKKFRIAHVFLLTAILSIALGWISMERHVSEEEIGVARHFLDKGSAVVFNSPYDSWDSVKDGGEGHWLSVIAQNIFGKRPVVISVESVDAMEMELLSTLTNLHRLHVESNKVSDNEIRLLERSLEDCEVIRVR